MKKTFRSSSLRPLLVSIVAILFGFLVGSILLIASGQNPIQCFIALFKGGLSSKERIFNTFSNAIPLVFTGLSVTFAYKTGLFNIGATGQMVAAGLLSVITALTVDLPRPLLLPLVVLVGFLGGAVYGGIQGYLKSRFNVNEVVSGIMMNWIAHWAVYYVISDYFKSSSMATESQSVPAAASLRSDLLLSFTGSSSFNWGFILAIACVVIVQYILRRTVIGYEMRAVGFNAEAAEYGGINVKKNAVLSMAIAGALAGLAGVSYYCGYCTAIRIGVQPRTASTASRSPARRHLAGRRRVCLNLLRHPANRQGLYERHDKDRPRNCRHHHCHHHLFCGHQQVCRPVLRPVLGLVS